MLAPAHDKMTVEQFLDVYQHIEGKYELVDGVVYAMSGGSARHASAATRLLVAFWTRLQGSKCQPFNSDMGLRVDSDTLRYPDIAIYCDPRDLDRDDLDTREFRYPKVVIEILSPTTAKADRSFKVVEYKTIETVATIVLIDPATQRLEVHERRGTDEWLQRLMPPGSGLELTDPPLMLTHAEVFGS